MKTSVIGVPDMLSVLTVDEVEARFEEVPGVESATVNFAAGNVTVRFDETLLEVADIKIYVHQRGQKTTGGTEPAHESGIKAEQVPAAASTPGAPPTPASPPPAAPNAEPASAAMRAPTAPGAGGGADEPAKDAPPSSVAG